MKYLLVIQFAVDKNVDLNSLTEIEETIIDSIDPKHEIDGHDFGVNEFNIFIYTNDPHDASSQVKRTIRSKKHKQMKIAYRLSNGEEYKIIYPENFTGKFEVK